MRYQPTGKKARSRVAKGVRYDSKVVSRTGFVQMGDRTVHATRPTQPFTNTEHAGEITTHTSACNTSVNTLATPAVLTKWCLGVLVEGSGNGFFIVLEHSGGS